MLRDISDLRKSYQKNSLTEKDLPLNPFSLFDRWFKEVKSNSGNSEVNAMTLSTIDKSGFPTLARIFGTKSQSLKESVFLLKVDSSSAPPSI